VTQADFALSETISGVNMRLTAGGTLGRIAKAGAWSLALLIVGLNVVLILETLS
jgi:hypothetical protein